MSCDEICSSKVANAKNSLLKYERARVFFTKDATKRCRSFGSLSENTATLYDERLNLVDPFSEACRRSDIVDLIFPPMETIDRLNRKYIVCVSRDPATKFDVENLEKTFDFRLKNARALPVGLCDRRRSLYDQVFDELLRQVTIECGERGILLSRVRDFYRQLIKTYSNVSLSASAYAMRTFLLNEKFKFQINQQIQRLHFDIQQLREQLNHAEDHFENLSQLYSNLKFAVEKRYSTFQSATSDELKQLRSTNSSLKQELDEVLTRKLSPTLFHFVTKTKDQLNFTKNQNHFNVK